MQHSWISPRPLIDWSPHIKSTCVKVKDYKTQILYPQKICKSVSSPEWLVVALSFLSNWSMSLQFPLPYLFSLCNSYKLLYGNVKINNTISTAKVHNNRINPDVGLPLQTSTQPPAKSSVVPKTKPSQRNKPRSPAQRAGSLAGNTLAVSTTKLKSNSRTLK